MGSPDSSAMNAIAHAAEGLYAPDGNPIVALMAEEGIRAAAGALPRLSKDAHDLAARGDALYAAWLCGTVLAQVSMGLHHKLCHTLGGSFDLPHAEVHTVVLPHALAYNAAAAPAAMRRIERALQAARLDASSATGTPDSDSVQRSPSTSSKGSGSSAGNSIARSGSSAAAGIFDLARDHGAPTALRDLGMPAAGLDRAADLAVENRYPNPRPLERAALRELLQRAWEGTRPD